MESDEGGIALLRALSISQARDRIRVATLEGFKDASDMHMACPERFKNRIERAIGKAVPLERLLKNVPELTDVLRATLLVCRADIAGGRTARSNIWTAKMRRASHSGAGSAPRSNSLAVTRDQDQHAWGLLLHVKTPDGHWHQWAGACGCYRKPALSWRCAA
jgi:hypothetical protein